MADTKIRPLSDGELSVFCSQCAMLLRSGIAPAEGLAIMAQDAAEGEGRAILETAKAHCEAGEPLSAGLGATGAFPQYLLDMAAIGEQSGRLDDVMDSLAAYYEREEALHESIRSAVRYPLVMIAMMAVVLIVLMVRVLPVFNEVFLQLGAQMSGVSLSILHVGQALSRYSAVFVALAAILALYYLWSTKTASGRAWRARRSGERVLGSRKLAAKVASARFASGMSLMMASGLDVDKSLAMVSKLIGSAAVRAKIAVCQQRLAEGKSFGDALSDCGLFSGVYARMVAVGFKTGSADAVLRKLADRCEDEVDAETARLVSLVEPTLVAVFSVLVGLILLSVMLPLMGIMSSIG